MRSGRPIRIELAPDERHVLEHGLREWSGPVACTDALAATIGFGRASDVGREVQRLTTALADDALTHADWRVVLLATEIVFASAVIGAGWDWASTSGLTDGETIQILRRIQRKFAEHR